MSRFLEWVLVGELFFDLESTKDNEVQIHAATGLVQWFQTGAAPESTDTEIIKSEFRLHIRDQEDLKSNDGQHDTGDGKSSG